MNWNYRLTIDTQLQHRWIENFSVNRVFCSFSTVSCTSFAHHNYMRKIDTRHMNIHSSPDLFLTICKPVSFIYTCHAHHESPVCVPHSEARSWYPQLCWLLYRGERLGEALCRHSTLYFCLYFFSQSKSLSHTYFVSRVSSTWSPCAWKKEKQNECVGE